MNIHPSLRLTPSNSPLLRTTSPRSPTRQPKSDEAGLQLTKVIGTTAASTTAFDALPSARQCAFTAGAAAVLATVEDDLSLTQQFFRAYPGSASNGRDGAWPLTPSGDSRGRGTGNLKELGSNAPSPSPLGTGTRDWQDSPNGRSSTAKDKVKAATSVAISRNGKWLALGETGYRPRVLIFSTRDDCSETPVAAMAEHSFGVHALSFSPDSKYLASLGTVNDGFLYVWSIDDRTGAATLHASNKCTALIHTMCWLGQSVVTAGLRYVKVWRPYEDNSVDTRSIDIPRGSLTARQRNELRSSDFGNSILGPRHRVLLGKNSLLNDLLDATFLAILPLSDMQALLCTEAGEICLLDDSDRTQTIVMVERVDMRVSTARLSASEESLHVLGWDGQSAIFNVRELIVKLGQLKDEPRRQTLIGATAKPAGSVAVVATTTFDDIVLEVRSDRTLTLSRLDGAGEIVATRQMPAHNDPVFGVQPFESSALPNAAFLTYAGNGNIRFWTDDGHAAGQHIQVPTETSPEMYGLVNELRAVVPLSCGQIIAVGDRYGTITLVDVRSTKPLHRIRAHTAEVLDLICFERDGIELLVSASRDRTVQLLIPSRKADNTIELVVCQTLDEHAGAVNGLLISRDRNQLLSCSADRTVVVRDAMLRDPRDPTTVAFVITRTITLKSAPTSFCLGQEDDSLYIAMVDRSIAKYSMRAGQPSFTFKCNDTDNGEAVTMSKIVYTPSLNGNPTIAGVSSSDKSVRLYTEYGTLIARDWGHTEGITDMALVPCSQRKRATGGQTFTIVTVAADSTVFLWDSLVSNGRPGSQPIEITIPTTSTFTLPLAPPLRKVLSYSEISRFRREKSIDENAEADPPSPPVPSPIPVSPHRLRKKTSRLSMAQTPRLEPPIRTFDTSRRSSLRNRSPSPPSPRAKGKKDTSRRPSLGMSYRSKSTDNILNTVSRDPPPPLPTNTGFGTLTSSTESVCRTLRAYRKKLVTSTSSDSIIAPEMLRELDKELKLTLRLVAEKSQGKALDEAMVAKLLEQASDKIVGLLDEKIKERVESEVRKTSDSIGAVPGPPRLESPSEMDEDELAAAQALGKSQSKR